MAKNQSLLSKANLPKVATAFRNAVENQMPPSKALQQLEPNRRLVSERAKQLFRLLLASGAEKAKSVAHFFANLEERLAKSSMGVTYKHFGFDSWKSFAEHVRRKIIAIKIDADNVKEFQKGMKGRKWWFMGDLWERYIKYGPVRRFLDDTAQDALNVINQRIKPGASYTMVDALNKEIKITKRFGKLLAGVEFILETEQGEKAYLDFGHIAFNKQGYSILPVPIEIKLPSAAGGVPKQFSEFVPRLRSAKKLIIKFEKSDLEKVKEHVGSGILKHEMKDGLIYAEIDHTKLVFDPLARNQIIVKPGRKEWGEVICPGKSPNIEIGVSTTTKGPIADRFFFWKFEVGVSRSPFERIFQAIFLGTK